MKLFGEPWTPETADQWTFHDLIASVLSAYVFIALALGGAWTIVGRMAGWWLIASTVGASLLLWAVIDRKLIAQSESFERREETHKDRVEERQRWGH